MAGIQLYQTEQDETLLVEAALSQGCWLTPDINYETSQVIEIRSIEEFIEIRPTERHFFILHNTFLRMPLCLREIEKNGKKVFYVSPSEGGPFLEFLGGGIFESEPPSERRIRPGFLHFNSGYWDHAITRKEPSPPELAEMFKRMSKVIRKNSLKIKPGMSVHWLGHDAKTQLLQGAKLVGYETWSVPSASTRSSSATFTESSESVS